MKNAFVFSLLLGISFSVYAGPFGLEKGMTLEQITDVCGSVPKHISDDRYLVSPIKKHPDFENYIVWINGTNGLYYIKAISREIKTNGYGLELKSLFSNIETSLSKIYGKSTITDELDPQSVFKGDDYWMWTLSQGARSFFATWKNSYKPPMPDSITSIVLYATAETSAYGYVMLEYEFDNNAKVEEEKSSVF